MRPRHALALLSSAAVLAACAPAQTDGTDAQADEATGTLRVWLFDEVDRAPKEDVVEAAVEEFEDTHDDVTVDVSYIQVDGRQERFNAAFNDPESAPDVAEFGNTDLPGFVAAGGMAELTEEIEDWDQGDQLDAAITETARVDGATYAVPWFVGARALYYRTDVLEDIDTDPPETLDEVVDTARAARAESDLLGLSTGGNYLWALLPFIWANGGDLAEESGDGYTATIDSPPARAGVDQYTELLSDDVCPPQTCAEMGGNESVDNFVAGEAAMTLGGNFNYAAVSDSDIGDDFDVIPLPGQDPGSVAPAFAGGNHLGVFAGSDRHTLAVEFTQLLAGAEYQERMYEAMGNLPTLTPVQEDVAATDPEMEPFIATLEAGTRFVPATEAWTTIDAQAVLPSMVQQVATGDESVQDATSEAADRMNDAFDES
ncbi:extracellular solute-binding protein [Lipingzhangella sp. LS1_29]|uniref:Extracellular solute-binding protein n=1 Tax=Lipingzhangella rawalii TaxID=2055835 RepID=A0ABU2H1R9_9ACTN|nr:extracellular solute-binding protein [Lipingzhangella rawalii]MDS1269238.1 extracellular solute-binding protein [Lipingzhangella rawalii]